MGQRQKDRIGIKQETRHNNLRGAWGFSPSIDKTSKKNKPGKQESSPARQAKHGLPVKPCKDTRPPSKKSKAWLVLLAKKEPGQKPPCSQTSQPCKTSKAWLVLLG